MKAIIKATCILLVGIGCGALGQAGYIRAEIIENPLVILAMVVIPIVVYGLVNYLEDWHG